MPKISLLYAAYNAETYIQEAIESGLRQSFKDIEFPESLSNRRYKEQPEVSFRLLRDAIQRRRLNVRVELFYDNGHAKYKFIKSVNTTRLNIRNT